MTCEGITLDPLLLLAGGVLLLVLGACLGAIAVAVFAIDEVKR